MPWLAGGCQAGRCGRNLRGFRGRGLRVTHASATPCGPQLLLLALQRQCPLLLLLLLLYHILARGRCKLAPHTLANLLPQRLGQLQTLLEHQLSRRSRRPPVTPQHN
jgi:hypothetical protein